MNHFIVEDGKVKQMTKEAYEKLPGRHVSEVIKDMAKKEYVE